MPDQTVKVTFTPPNKFNFNPEVAFMNASGKIIFHREPGSSSWTFVSINELPKPPFSWSLTGNGSGINVDDDYTVMGEFTYTVTVHDETGNHTSQPGKIIETLPPMIKNQ
jgi:hypothetical protein